MDYVAIHMLEGLRKSRAEGSARRRRDEGGWGSEEAGWVRLHIVFEMVAI